MSPLSWRKTLLKFASRLGHNHPMDVLHYSVTKSIMLFQLADHMPCATQGAIKAMVLHEEAIAIRVSPPFATHVKVYMGLVGGEPSRTQPPPSDGEEELHSPAGNPHTGWGTATMSPSRPQRSSRQQIVPAYGGSLLKRSHSVS